MSMNYEMLMTYQSIDVSEPEFQVGDSLVYTTPETGKKIKCHVLDVRCNFMLFGMPYFQYLCGFEDGYEDSWLSNSWLDLEIEDED